MNGVLYIATGAKHVQEAIINARFSRNYLSNIGLAIVTDQPEQVEQANVFDQVIEHSDVTYSYRDKIPPLLSLPYDLTLFLDSDAFAIHSLDSLFELGQYCDFAAAMATVRHPPGWNDKSIPKAFPEFNSGVLLMRRSSQQYQLVCQWLSLYDQILSDFNHIWDQASLRSVLWTFMSSNRLRFLTLPQEFNLRTPRPWVAGRGMPVHIIHGRFEEREMNSFVDYLNSDVGRFREFSEWLECHPESRIRPQPVLIRDNHYS